MYYFGQKKPQSYYKDMIAMAMKDHVYIYIRT